MQKPTHCTILYLNIYTNFCNIDPISFYEFLFLSLSLIFSKIFFFFFIFRATPRILHSFQMSSSIFFTCARTVDGGTVGGCIGMQRFHEENRK